MLVTVSIKKLKGVLTLIVDASELHKELDKIGVERGDYGFLMGPREEYSVVNVTENRISANVLLNTVYPVNYALTDIFRVPPTVQSLSILAASAEQVTRNILNHYMPIDIKMVVRKCEV
jgi:hypothetical protein